MINIENVIDVAIEAGILILKIYNSDDYNIGIKPDTSPLTVADTVSHELVEKRLLSLYPSIPILSEEGKDIKYEVRKNWNRFWLIDPLDGTKEFINRNGEFTVNIALIENNVPVLGVIYAPAFNSDLKNSEHRPGSLYYAQKDIGAFKIMRAGNPIRLPYHTYPGYNIAVRSRSHSSPKEEEILNELNVKKTISIGSSLKFCMVAEGQAQIYYRHGPTYEWDVAAGYAIAKYAGNTIRGLTFNKQTLLNNSFIVKSIS